MQIRPLINKIVRGVITAQGVSEALIQQKLSFRRNRFGSAKKPINEIARGIENVNAMITVFRVINVRAFSILDDHAKSLSMRHA
jgi:hypothetical protein